MLNSRNIDDLRPDVAAACRYGLELCKKKGLNVLVTATVRDDEYQMWCVKNGYASANATKPTFHSVKAGLAFDFCKNVKGQEYNDIPFFKAVADVFKGLGFFWGGDWKRFPDKPHLQWDGYKHEYTGSDILAGRYPPELIIEEDEDMAKRYNTVAELPAWAKPTIEKLVAKKLLQGDGGKFDLSEDMIRILVINDRAGVYG